MDVLKNNNKQTKNGKVTQSAKQNKAKRYPGTPLYAVSKLRDANFIV